MATRAPVKDLAAKVELRKRQLKSGWMLFGGWCGLVVSGSLISTSRRRRNRDYITDRLNCVCCSRCYAYCPRELKRKKIEVETEHEN
jgi:hypothetical protein